MYWSQGYSHERQFYWNNLFNVLGFTLQVEKAICAVLLQTSFELPFFTLGLQSSRRRCSKDAHNWEYCRKSELCSPQVANSNCVPRKPDTRPQFQALSRNCERLRNMKRVKNIGRVCSQRKNWSPIMCKSRIQTKPRKGTLTKLYWATLAQRKIEHGITISAIINTIDFCLVIAIARRSLWDKKVEQIDEAKERFLRRGERTGVIRFGWWRDYKKL